MVGRQFSSDFSYHIEYKSLWHDFHFLGNSNSDKGKSLFPSSNNKQQKSAWSGSQSAVSRFANDKAAPESQPHYSLYDNDNASPRSEPYYFRYDNNKASISKLTQNRKISK